MNTHSGGDKVWVFDLNRRVYAPGAGGATYSEHFYESTIERVPRGARTITVDRIKFVHDGNGVYRDDRGTRTLFFTQEDVANDIWMHDNIHKILRWVDECNNVALLKQIADMLKADRATNHKDSK